MRTFLAIPVPDFVKRRMAAVGDELRAVAPDSKIRWVPEGQFHLTLRFLGEMAPERLPSLVEILGQACGHFHGFRMEAAGLGFFPNERRPRVIWVGLNETTGELSRLQQAVAAAAADFAAEQEENRFSAHATLGRVKFLVPGESRALVTKARQSGHRSFGSWDATHIEVLRSELSSEGSSHFTIAQLALGRPLNPISK